MIIDSDGHDGDDGDPGDSSDPDVTVHAREGSDDLAHEADRLLGALDQARDSYRDAAKDSPAVARSAFAEQVGMAVNALRGKLEEGGEGELAGELRWDLEAEDFDAEIQRVRSTVEQVAAGGAGRQQDPEHAEGDDDGEEPEG